MIKRRAMILSAGYGKRMHPLTLTRPKPMLPIQGKPLLEHQIVRLRDAGFCEIVINIAYLGQQIKDYFSYGDRWGVQLSYSDEGSSPLGVSTGIRYALDKLGEAVFLVINGDVWSDYDLSLLQRRSVEKMAHLVMITPNPPHNLEGDFSLQGDTLSVYEKPRFTYSGIGLYTPRFFRASNKKSMRSMLEEAIVSDQITGELYQGVWLDIGTVERYRLLQTRIDFS